jgi:hypothetical protein
MFFISIPSVYYCKFTVYPYSKVQREEMRQKKPPDMVQVTRLEYNESDEVSGDGSSRRVRRLWAQIETFQKDSERAFPWITLEKQQKGPNGWEHSIKLAEPIATGAYTTLGGTHMQISKVEYS